MVDELRRREVVVVVGVVEMWVFEILEGREDGWSLGDGRVWCRGLKEEEEEEIEIEIDSGSRRRSSEMMKMVVVKMMEEEIVNVVVKIVWKRCSERKLSKRQSRRNEHEILCRVLPLDPNRRLFLTTTTSSKRGGRPFCLSLPGREEEACRVGRKGEVGVRRDWTKVEGGRSLFELGTILELERTAREEA